MRPIDVNKANENAKGTSFRDNAFFLPLQNPDMQSQVDDLEEELKEVSMELAGSIRRELELEDMVDRLQFESNSGPDLGRRTSDYFSDSGASSIRYPPSESGGAKADDAAKQKRSSEQEKAKFKLELSQKLQDEREKRKILEGHIQQLGQQVHSVGVLVFCLFGGLLTFLSLMKNEQPHRTPSLIYETWKAL